jgi:hypothetical protein
VDERQLSLFGAGWTLGSLKYLGESGAASVTFYETTGWRGVMERPDGSPLPDRFPSLPGGVFPLYHVLADVGEFAGSEVMRGGSSAPLRVESLALRAGARTRLLLANLTPQPQEVTVTAGETPACLRLLDETNAEEAIQSPEEFRARPGAPLEASGGEFRLTLPPYAVARIDSA